MLDYQKIELLFGNIERKPLQTIIYILIAIFISIIIIYFGTYVMEAAKKDTSKNIKNSKKARYLKYIVVIIPTILLIFYLTGYFTNQSYSKLNQNSKVIHHNNVSPVILTIKDLNHSHDINNEKNVIVYLPSMDNSNIGSWIEIIKSNTGYIVVKAANKDKFINQFGGDCMVNYTKEIGSILRVEFKDLKQLIFKTYFSNAWHPMDFTKSFFPKN